MKPGDILRPPTNTYVCPACGYEGGQNGVPVYSVGRPTVHTGPSCPVCYEQWRAKTFKMIPIVKPDAAQAP